MNWKDYLKSQGFKDDQIAKMATEFGEEGMAKAFAQPIAQLAEAQSKLDAATAQNEEFQTFYQNDVLPKVSSVYQEAINARTRAAALEERLKSAKDLGFLTDPKILEGIIPGVPATALPPGSPAAPGAPANSGQPAPGTGALDSRYVSGDAFNKFIADAPKMLANLADISNQHMSLFGKPLEDVQDLVNQAVESKGKLNVRQAWETKYKVAEKRAEITRLAAAAHDKEVADAAVQKYASEHNMPFSAPGRTTVAPHFTPSSPDEARKPWANSGAGQRTRREERRQLFIDSMSGRRPATGTAA